MALGLNSGLAPVMNWNQGAKTLIRSSFASRRAKTEIPAPALSRQLLQQSPELPTLSAVPAPPNDSTQDSTQATPKDADTESKIDHGSTVKSKKAYAPSETAVLSDDSEETAETPFDSENDAAMVTNVIERPSEDLKQSAKGENDAPSAPASPPQPADEKNIMSTAELDTDDPDDEDYEPEESDDVGDAMQIYASSDPSVHEAHASANTVPSASVDPPSTSVAALSTPDIAADTQAAPDIISTSVIISNEMPPPLALTLSQLSPDDLALQVRYFYMSCDPSTIPSTDLVRCLVCGQRGHVSEACSSRQCTICGSVGEHFTYACPQSMRCTRCQQRGHEVVTCPLKLKPDKPLTTQDLVCQICSLIGHDDLDCEMRWRTSGQPWARPPLSTAIRLGCYECGRSGHLGNDCPTRRPGKPLGSSSWSLDGRPPAIPLGGLNTRAPTSRPANRHAQSTRPGKRPFAPSYGPGHDRPRASSNYFQDEADEPSDPARFRRTRAPPAAHGLPARPPIRIAGVTGGGLGGSGGRRFDAPSSISHGQPPLPRSPPPSRPSRPSGPLADYGPSFPASSVLRSSSGVRGQPPRSQPLPRNQPPLPRGPMPRSNPGMNSYNSYSHSNNYNYNYSHPSEPYRPLPSAAGSAWKKGAAYR